MTQAAGTSTIHETIMTQRFRYVDELQAMGAHIELFQPEVADPESIYNFNLSDDLPGAKHAIKIFGPTQLHGGSFTVKDLRHGATLVQAALTATGEKPNTWRWANLSRLRKSWRTIAINGAQITLVSDLSSAENQVQ